MFKPNSAAVTYSLHGARKFADTLKGPRSAPGQSMISSDANGGAALGTTGETATPKTLISACLFCRYRKPTGQTGESANA